MPAAAHHGTEQPDTQHASLTHDPNRNSKHTIYTNQYAVTEQSHEVAESLVPGIFFKYDIEPILLTVAEEWGGFLGLLIRCVNVIAGILVAGGWLVSMLDWAGEVTSRRRRRSDSGLIGQQKEKESGGDVGGEHIGPNGFHARSVSYTGSMYNEKQGYGYGDHGTYSPYGTPRKE